MNAPAAEPRQSTRSRVTASASRRPGSVSTQRSSCSSAVCTSSPSCAARCAASRPLGTQHRGVQALDEAQFEHDAFDPPRLGVQYLPTRGRRGSLRQPTRVARRAQDVPPADPGDMGVGARADAPPVVPHPVAVVVGAARARARGPVGHLVPRQPAGAQYGVGLLVAPRLRVGVRRGHRPAPDPCVQRGPRFDRQGVHAHPVGRGGHGEIERLGPVLVGLARGAEDQVEPDDGEPGRACFPGRRHRASRRVHPVEYGEHVLRGALHAERDTVDPGLAECVQRRGVDAFRIGLHGDLGLVRDADLLARHRQHARQLTRAENGRRAAAEVHGAQRRPAVTEALRGEAHLGDRGVHVAGRRVGSRLARRVGVEVAVAAARRAERHVHVQAERPLTDGACSRVRQRAVGGGRVPGGQAGGHRDTVSRTPGDPVSRARGARPDPAPARRARWRSG